MNPGQASAASGSQCGPMSVVQAKVRPAPWVPDTSSGWPSGPDASTVAPGFAITSFKPSMTGQSAETSASSGCSTADGAARKPSGTSIRSSQGWIVTGSAASIGVARNRALALMP